MNTVLRSNILCITFLASMLAIEAVIILAAILQFVPLPVPSFVRDLFPINLSSVKPEREMLLYHCFISATILISMVGAFIYRRRMAADPAWPKIKGFVLLTAVALCIVLSIVFKHITTPALVWTRWAFPLALMGCLLLQVFYAEAKLFGHFYVARIWPKMERFPWGIVFLGILMLCLWVPDRTAVLARIYNVDQFYHFDGTVMASGWAWIKGCILNQDVISQYGVLLPMTIAKGAQILGGYNYDHVVLVLLLMTLVYCAGLYIFLSRWLEARWLGICGVLFFVKWDLFHREAYPFVWMIPNIIPIRYIFDVPVLCLLWWHAKTERPWALWAATVLTGVAFAYTIDTGVYLILALGAYVFFWHAHQGRWRSLLGTSLAVLAGVIGAAAISLGMATRGASFHAEFWMRFSEHARLFLGGWGALPINDGLKDGYYFAFWMGLLIPVFYLVSVLACTAGIIARKAPKQWIIAAVLGIYGLALFHYYIVRSASSNYYVVCMPFAALLCFWLVEITKTLQPSQARIARIVAVCWSIAALWSNTLFAFYPNALHLSNDDYSKEKTYFAASFKMEEDAAFIKRLTRPSDRVPLISSFDVELLRQADRAPFFYYFPLLTSRPLESDIIAGTYLHTHSRMAHTLRQLEDDKPVYVFIEKKIFLKTVNPGFFQWLQTVAELVQYLEGHYTQVDEGKYLVALKRNGA